MLKHLRKRAWPSNGFRTGFAQRRGNRRWSNQGEFVPVARLPVASPCWQLEGQATANIPKAKMGKEQGGRMTFGSCLFDMALESVVFMSQRRRADQINTTLNSVFLFFRSVFKEVRITAFGLSDFRNCPSGGN